MALPPTVAWENGVVVMIDQRRLPAEESLLRCRDHHEVACKKPIDIPREALLRAGFAEEDLDGSWQPYGHVGCDRCKGSGYKGRVGIYQVMPITEEMSRLIMKNGTAHDIADQARR